MFVSPKFDLILLYVCAKTKTTIFVNIVTYEKKKKIPEKSASTNQTKRKIALRIVLNLVMSISATCVTIRIRDYLLSERMVCVVAPLIMLENNCNSILDGMVTEKYGHSSFALNWTLKCGVERQLDHQSKENSTN